MAGTMPRKSVGVAGTLLKKISEEIKKRHASGEDGLSLCRLRTEAVDQSVRAIWAAILEDLPESDRIEVSKRVTVVAHGGYARGEMTPGSDVDLMLLHDITEVSDSPSSTAGITGPGDAFADAARRLLQDLFDAGLEVGQSVRTTGEAIQLASSDATIFSSLLEMRVLVGDESRCRKLVKRLRVMSQRSRRKMGRLLLEARREEARKYGETVYLLQPNVKRSVGGIRDIQLARWLAFLESDRLPPLGPQPLPEGESLISVNTGGLWKGESRGLSDTDFEMLGLAMGFLRNLRVELHIQAGRGSDELTREEQVRLAEKRQFKADAGMLGVEHFMQVYFGYTREVEQVTRGLMQQAEGGRRLRSWTTGLFGNRVDSCFVVGPMAVAVLPSSLGEVASDMDRIVRFIELSMLYEVPVEPTNWTALRQLIAKENPPVTNQARQRFLGFFSAVSPIGPALRRLHELRLLERLMPAFAHARGLLQFNNFHKYTVDEHCLLAVEKASELDVDVGWLGDVWRQVRRRRRILLLALLIHDLGKGYEGDHSEVGAGIAREVAALFQLDEAESEILEFLVLRHLLMAELAFRRNVDDDSLVLAFAREVGSPEVLRLLTVLTMADIAAVGPGVWNQWKAELLSDLYNRTLQFLDPDANDRGADLKRAEICNLVAHLDKDHPLARLAAGLPRGYIRSSEPEHVVDNLTRLTQLPEGGQYIAVQWQSETSTISVTVGLRASQVSGVFHRIAAGLASQRLEVLSADIHTLDDEYLIDYFRVVDRDFVGPAPESRLSEITQAVDSCLQNEIPSIRRRWNPLASEMQAAAVSPPRVQVDNDSSVDATIIEVFAEDSDGLLLSLSKTLYEHQFSVRSAKISTYLDQIVDAFHVVDFAGAKVEDSKRLTTIRSALQDAAGAGVSNSS
jgi:[protein-PII] uridylyltransferase